MFVSSQSKFSKYLISKSSSTVVLCCYDSKLLFFKLKPNIDVVGRNCADSLIKGSIPLNTIRLAPKFVTWRVHDNRLKLLDFSSNLWENMTLWLVFMFADGVAMVTHSECKFCAGALRWLPPVLHFPEPLNFTKGFLAHNDGLVPVLAGWCYNSF